MCSTFVVSYLVTSSSFLSQLPSIAAARSLLPIDGEVRPGSVRDPADPLRERVDDAAGPVQGGVAASVQAGLATAAEGFRPQPRC